VESIPGARGDKAVRAALHRFIDRSPLANLESCSDLPPTRMPRRSASRRDGGFLPLRAAFRTGWAAPSGVVCERQAPDFSATTATDSLEMPVGIAGAFRKRQGDRIGSRIRSVAISWQLVALRDCNGDQVATRVRFDYSFASGPEEESKSKSRPGPSLRSISQYQTSALGSALIVSNSFCRAADAPHGLVRAHFGRRWFPETAAHG
jgi:hypothetical protein